MYYIIQKSSISLTSLQAVRAFSVGANIAHTPLFDLHNELKGKIVEFAGYALPVQYSGVLPVFSVLVSFTYRNTQLLEALTLVVYSMYLTWVKLSKYSLFSIYQQMDW